MRGAVLYGPGDVRLDECVAAGVRPGMTVAVARIKDLAWRREIDPGQVFDLTLPLDQVAEGYRAMDERRAIKSLFRSSASCITW